MKFVRILAIVPLVLISLMNVGYPFGTDPKPDLAVWPSLVLVLGTGRVRGRVRPRPQHRWGIPAALAVAGVNVVAAIIALVSDTEGAIIGLVVSSLALVLAFVAGSGTRKVSVA